MADEVLNNAADGLAVIALGAMVSQYVRRLLPHDGCTLVGFDPITGAVCFRADHHGYSVAAARLVKPLVRSLQQFVQANHCALLCRLHPLASFLCTTS